MWCLDNYLLFLHSRKHPWSLPYEKHITQNHSELKRICNAIGAEIINKTLKTLDKPSSYVKENADAQLLKWKQQLTPKQIDDILSIGAEIGLSRFYFDSIKPDYQ